MHANDKVKIVLNKHTGFWTVNAQNLRHNQHKQMCRDFLNIGVLE